MAFRTHKSVTFSAPTDFGPAEDMVLTSIMKLHGKPVARINKDVVTGTYSFRVNKADGFSHDYKTKAGCVKAALRAAVDQQFWGVTKTLR